MNLQTLFIVIGLSAFMAPLIQKLFFRLNKIDLINQRSSHSVRATRTGGVSSFSINFFIELALVY